MSQKFLYPFRRRIETIAALYAAGFGLLVWIYIQSDITSPLSWLNVSAQAQVCIAYALVLAALLHALGIKINGSWRWSPLLRFIGMSVHAFIIMWMSYKGGGTSASYTYSWISILLLYGSYSAIRDLGISLNWGNKWRLH